MKLTIEFDTDNAAFEESPLNEIDLILDDITHRVHAGKVEGRVRDSNGNTVGEWSWR